MTKTLLVCALVAVLVVVVGLVVLRAAPSIGATAANPSYVVVNTPTAVVVTAAIRDLSLIATSVNLLRIDESGGTTANLGQMYDDGTNGDSVSGDKIFSRTIDLHETTPGMLHLEVSAAFRGVLRRVAGLTTLPVWSRDTYGTSGLEVAIPPDWTVSKDPSGMWSLFPPDTTTDVSREYDGDIKLFEDRNPSSLDIHDFYNGFNGVALFEDATRVSTTMVNGHQAYWFSTSTGLVAGDVMVVVLPDRFIRIEDRKNPFVFQQVVGNLNISR